MKEGQPVKLHGVDVRIMDEEQAWHLNRLKMKQNIHIAWDLPQLDLTERLKEFSLESGMRIIPNRNSRLFSLSLLSLSVYFRYSPHLNPLRGV